MTFPIPGSVQKAPKTERGVRSLRFKLRVAALYGTPDGTLKALANACGIDHSTLACHIARENIPAPLCVKLEKLCGADQFPRSWFNPTLFGVQGNSDVRGL